MNMSIYDMEMKRLQDISVRLDKMEDWKYSTMKRLEIVEAALLKIIEEIKSGKLRKEEEKIK